MIRTSTMFTSRLALSSIAIALALSSTSPAAADDTISLFSGVGKPEAYIALDDEMTIYLWSGTPVAYLKKSNDGFDVYGFNGDHLGWFVKGVIWGRDGSGACASKAALRSTEYEPYKPFRQFKPFKSFAQFAPSQPFLTGRFGDMPCRLLLASGAK